MVLAIAGVASLLLGVGVGLRHVEHYLVLVAHIHRYQMRVLLAPPRQVLLVAAITSEKIGVAKMHQDVRSLRRAAVPKCLQDRR